MTIPEAVDAGYFPKRTVKRLEWLKASGVEEICSVSLCISSGPSDWIQKWLHNDLGFYDTEALAWRVVGPERVGIEMYAYRAYPLMFAEGEVTAWPVSTQVTLDLSRFEFLGFDIANMTVGTSNFGCSPLSCNGGAEDFPVNRYCLMQELTVAYEACAAISRGEYEPGPYHLLQVYRQRPSG